jgi:N6-adenosine-specific RNA methylase IME4
VYLHCFGVLNLALMVYCMRDVGDEFSHVLNWYKTSSQGCVCVCVCVFLRHTSKYRLALLRTVCVRARERLGKKEGKIHS